MRQEFNSPGPCQGTVAQYVLTDALHMSRHTNADDALAATSAGEAIRMKDDWDRNPFHAHTHSSATRPEYMALVIGVAAVAS